jgi:fucose permease
MKNLTAIVAIMAVFTLAVCFIMIGSISVELMAKLGLSTADIGTLMFVFSLTGLAVQLLAGPLVDKFGHKPLAIAGFLVASVSIFLLGFAPSFAWTLLAAILLAAGAILCNTVGNTLLPVVLFGGKDPARASNFGNAFVGLGFALPPLLIGVLINDVGIPYSYTVSLIGILVLAFAVVATLPAYPQVSTGFQLARAVGLLKHPMVLIAALALVCYIALEFTMTTWINTLMNELFTSAGSAHAARNAGLVLALFSVGVTIGRLATSTVKNLSAIGARVIAAGAAVSIVLILVLSHTHSQGLAIAAVFAIGLVFAPMFPTIVGVTFARFNPSLYGSIFGIIFSIGFLGPTFLPKLIGNLSAQGSVQRALPIAAVVAGALLVAALVMDKVRATGSAGTAEPRRAVTE